MITAFKREDRCLTAAAAQPGRGAGRGVAFRGQLAVQPEARVRPGPAAVLDGHAADVQHDHRHDERVEARVEDGLDERGAPALRGHVPRPVVGVQRLVVRPADGLLLALLLLLHLAEPKVGLGLGVVVGRHDHADKEVPARAMATSCKHQQTIERLSQQHGERPTVQLHHSHHEEAAKDDVRDEQEDPAEVVVADRPVVRVGRVDRRPHDRVPVLDR
eukprot:SAG22_NODE_2176_length_2884_cov_1.337882_2_plen_217_part_00